MAEWTVEMIAQLRTLWDEGLSTSQIGLRMGITKNGIVGKAHRLDLPGRPSPIKARNGTPWVRPQRAPRQTLPLLASIPTAAPVRLEPRQSASLGRRPAAPSPEKAPEQPKPSFHKTCQFPIGDPKSRGFRFCDDVTRPGSSYCETHHQLCYHRVPVRREMEMAA